MFAIQLTRHGARAPCNHIDFPNITTHPWEEGLGQLTGQGERQHYLLGKKHYKRYQQENQLLSEKFDPREILIYSTDVNRTLMSAYSELLAWYPLGTVEEIKQKYEKQRAQPPFEVKNKDKIIKELGNFPTMDGFQPVPIHTGKNIDKLLRANDEAVCPIVEFYYEKAKKDKKFKEVNKRYADNILKTIHDDWKVNQTLDFATVDPWTDSYFTAMFDLRLKEEFELDNDKVNEMLADRYYYFYYLFDEVKRLVSTNFLNFVYTKMDQKISFQNSKNSAETEDFEDIKDLKLVFMSAHDSTLAAILSGVQQPQDIQPLFASSILIELWKREGSSEKNDENSEFYVKWILDDKNLNIGGVCDSEGNCPYEKFKEFLESREYQGDWEEACNAKVDDSIFSAKNVS